jgi:phosphocarrier protein HPr
MPSMTVVVTCEEGLHARPAALFVQAANRAPAKVSIAKDGGTAVDARSILAVLGLDVRQGDAVVLETQGDGADRVLDDLARLLTPPMGQ